MTYKWEAIAQDLTEERDRLLKELDSLREVAYRTLNEVSWFVSRKKNLAEHVMEDPNERIWAEVLNSDLEPLRAALKSEKQ